MQHGELLLTVAGLSQRMAKGPAQQQRSGGLDLLGDVAEQHDADRRNTGRLDRARDQSHGLIAEPSSWCQQDGVDALLLEPRRDLRGGLSRERRQMLPLDVAHEAVGVGQRAQHTAINQGS